MTVLVIGIILLALLVGVSLLQYLARRRDLSRESRLPFVAELRDAGLPRAQFPGGFHVQFQGPVTSERIAFAGDEPEAALDELDGQGRLIGYRQLFRDPRSFGEITDVLLNLALRRNRPQRQIRLDLTLYEDGESAATASADTPDAQPEDSDGSSVRIAEVDRHGLDFADSVREWRRIGVDGEAQQRMVEIRWHDGRVAVTASADSEPPGGVADEDLFAVARTARDRIAGSDLRHEDAPTR